MESQSWVKMTEITDCVYCGKFTTNCCHTCEDIIPLCPNHYRKHYMDKHPDIDYHG